MNSYDLIRSADIPMFTIGELSEIKRIARTLPESPIVIIIGAGIGASSLAILEEVPDVLIFSIDNQFPTHQAMYKPGERATLIETGYYSTGKVIQVWGESQIVGLKWPIKYDYLLIDGDHRYNGVKNDINIWTNHANDGAIISLHDYAPKKDKPKAGVKRAVDELIAYDRVSLVDTLISFKVIK